MSATARSSWALLRLGAARRDVLRRADLVVEEHRGQREQAVADADEHQVLLRPQHEAAERGALAAAHDLEQQLVGALGAFAVARGQEEIGVVEVDRVDVLEVDEGLDLDRAGLARGGQRELLVGEHDLFAVVELVAVPDLLVGDLAVLVGAEAVRLDRRAVLLVQLVEVHVEVAHGAEELHRHVDQPEAERSAPQRARHHRPPSRLACSAAIRSTSRRPRLSAGGSISSPAALRSITSRTAWRYSSL